MTLYAASFSRKSSELQELFDAASTTMKNINLPEENRESIQSYISVSNATLSSQKELESFLSLISPTLKLEVNKHIFSTFGVNNDFFKNRNDIIEFLSKMLKSYLFLPEDVIIKQGDHVTSLDRLYFLISGRCEIFVNTEDRIEKYEKDINSGSYFGEIAIIKKCDRTATIKSKDYTIITSITAADYKKFKTFYPDVAQRINNKIYSYDDRWKKFLRKLLQQIDFLSYEIFELVEDNLVSNEALDYSGQLENLPFQQSKLMLDDFLYELEMKTYEADKTIFKYDETCKCIYLIVDGEVDIILVNKNYKNYLTTLTQGSNIGMFTTLNQGNHAFSCKAKSNSTLMLLSYKSIEKLRLKYPDLNNCLFEYETFLEEDDPPYCDFKIFRKRASFKPRVVFRNAVKRMRAILKNTKQQIEFSSIVKRVKEQIK